MRGWRATRSRHPDRRDDVAPGRSALIIATSTYSDPRLATLAGPAKDAAALKGVLGAEDIGGFEVKTLLNARSAAIREGLEAFFTGRAREDLLLVSVSCHGLKDDDGQLFLAASDTKLDRLMSTGIDASWVNRLMDRCRVRADRAFSSTAVSPAPSARG